MITHEMNIKDIYKLLELAWNDGANSIQQEEQISNFDDFLKQHIDNPLVAEIVKAAPKKSIYVVTYWVDKRKKKENRNYLANRFQLFDDDTRMHLVRLGIVDSTEQIISIVKE